MKIVATSDLHNCLPEFDELSGDVLTISGDIVTAFGCSSDQQANFINNAFNPWCKKMKEKFNHIIIIAGNHDLVLQHRKDLINFNGDFIYLEDSGVEIDGVFFYGVPWTKPFFNWAFNAEDIDRKKVWDKVPEKTDILLSHGPPRMGNLDSVKNRYSSFKHDYAGDCILNECIIRVQPSFVFCGHIHENSGEDIQVNSTRIHNVSYLGPDYEEPNHNNIHKGYLEVNLE